MFEFYLPCLNQAQHDSFRCKKSMRAGSQEHDNSLRKISNVPRLAYSHEESQPPNSRSSSNLIVKWRPEDHKNQLSEGIEYRIGIMETSLSRFAMIFDSVQSDVMQVNKGTKELLLEMEFIRQKLIALDNSIQLLTKGQEEIKASIAGSLKSLSEHMSNQEKLQEVYSAISALPQLIRKSLQSVQSDLLNTTIEMQARNLLHIKKPQPKGSATVYSNFKGGKPDTLFSLQSISNRDTTSRKHQPVANEKKMNLRGTVVPKEEMGSWKPVKKERVTFSDRKPEKVHKENEPYTEKVGRDCAIVIESDEDTDGGFSCLVGKNAGKYLFGKLSREEEEEALSILQKARRRKRRYPNAMPITIL
ncbi:unnamed protein product [Lupinus luteus]|uniref:Protein PAIR1 n=1 Tax=Lupinus luteus TaxID=3873 RepID=A0AAV1X1C4_LUPLU